MKQGVYTDKAQLPTVQAIEALPTFGKDATIDDATPSDMEGHFPASGGTKARFRESPASLANKPVWHDLAPVDAMRQSAANGCLTRTRT